MTLTAHTPDSCTPVKESGVSETEIRQKISQEIEQADALPYESLGCGCREEIAALVRGGAPRNYELVNYTATCRTPVGNQAHAGIPVPFHNAAERQRWIDSHLEMWGHPFDGETYETKEAE